MSYIENRKSLRAMCSDLTLNGNNFNCLMEDDSDRETTLFLAIQGLYDTVFEKELEAEHKERQEWYDREDEIFEESLG